jgi:trehalose 6-phosphate phosphatase
MSSGTLTAPPPTPNSPENRPAAVPATASCRVRGIAGHTRGVPGPTATLDELLRPLKADPANSAVLLDVDGVLAPIVQHPDDAHMPETTRRPLIEVAKRYGVVACVSGRRASDARRIVSLGSIAYLGSHGSEVLRPGAIAPELDRELQAWTRRVQNFTQEAFGEELKRLRVRLEDKEAIAALHWRGVPDEDGAQAAVRAVAEQAEKAGFTAHWGKKVLEIRPPVRIDKGAGIVHLLRDRHLTAALYVGDDMTDIDAFHGLEELVASGRLDHAVKVGVRSDEGPPQLEAEADAMVEGTDGVRDLLRSLIS